MTSGVKDATRMLYHRTDAANAWRICAHGFSAELRARVWLTDHQGGAPQGWQGDPRDVVLVVTLPADLDLSRFEQRDPGKSYRAWLVPAGWLSNRVLTHVAPLPDDAEVTQ